MCVVTASYVLHWLQKATCTYTIRRNGIKWNQWLLFCCVASPDFSSIFFFVFPLTHPQSLSEKLSSWNKTEKLRARCSRESYRKSGIKTKTNKLKQKSPTMNAAVWRAWDLSVAFFGETLGRLIGAQSLPFNGFWQPIIGGWRWRWWRRLEFEGGVIFNFQNSFFMVENKILLHNSCWPYCYTVYQQYFSWDNANLGYLNL